MMNISQYLVRLTQAKSKYNKNSTSCHIVIKVNIVRNVSESFLILQHCSYNNIIILYISAASILNKFKHTNKTNQYPNSGPDKHRWVSENPSHVSYPKHERIIEFCTLKGNKGPVVA